MLPLPHSGKRPAVHCGTCEDHPLLPTHNEQINTRLCVRCQDKNRPLSLPHPEDHLCTVCRRECPTCQSPTPRGGECHACRRVCRTCSRPLGQPEPEAARVEQVEPSRTDRRRRWSRTYYPRSWGRDQCPACRGATAANDPVRSVLAALPNRLIRACAGGIPPSVIDTIHTELRRHTPGQLITRVERRWWNTWSTRPLRRASDDFDAYGPDDVAVWLLTPTPCAGRCEDGWHPAPPDRPDRDDQPCTTCRGGRLLTPVALPTDDAPDEEDTEAPATSPAYRNIGEAITYRPPVGECTGRQGACGAPVTAPYTQCPTCLNWPWCQCGHRRYNPHTATSCHICALPRP